MGLQSGINRHVGQFLFLVSTQIPGGGGGLGESGGGQVTGNPQNPGGASKHGGKWGKEGRAMDSKAGTREMGPKGGEPTNVGFIAADRFLGGGEKPVPAAGIGFRSRWTTPNDGGGVDLSGAPAFRGNSMGAGGF